MADAPSNNLDSSRFLSDPQVGNAVATKFLSEVNQTLTAKSFDYTAMGTETAAANDLSNLVGDPQQQAVLKAIAGKIESHDPVLGAIQGQVETDPKGNITGFVFTNPQQNEVYKESLATKEQQGNTLREAIATDGTSILDRDYQRGIMSISANGDFQDNTPLVAGPEYAPKPAPAQPPAPYYDGSNGVLTIGG